MTTIATGLAIVRSLTAAWREPFMQRALLEVVLLGTCGGALGAWIVFYELTFSAESLPHAMLPGLVAAALLGLPILLGGAVGLLTAAVVIALSIRVRAVGHDTAVAVVFTSLFGLGVLLALSPASPPGIGNLLFGDILGLSDTDLLVASVLTVVILLSLALLGPRLLAVALDRTTAGVVGADPRIIDLALIVLIALATLVAITAMGNLFVVATLVAPAAAARPLATTMRSMVLVAILAAIGSGVAGVYVSFYAHVAAGAAIAGCNVILFALAATAAWMRGRLDRRWAGAHARRPVVSP